MLSVTPPSLFELVCLINSDISLTRRSSTVLSLKVERCLRKLLCPYLSVSAHNSTQGATAALAASKGKLMLLRLVSIVQPFARIPLDIKAMTLSNINEAAGYNLYTFSLSFHRCHERCYIHKPIGSPVIQQQQNVFGSWELTSKPQHQI